MSGSGRNHVSKWDSKEDTHHHHSSVNEKSNTHYRDKEPEPVRCNGSRRSDDDDQHSGEAGTRSRVAQDNDNSYYYSEQDETMQQPFHRSGSRSYSRSRSRSISPVYRARRDAGFYDRHKTRMEHLHDGVSDPRLRRHRGEFTGQRRGGDGEGGFQRTWSIPCKFFAAGFCRNGNHCRFSHHDRKDRQDNNSFYRQDSNNHNRCNDVQRLDDNGKFGASSWIDGMEMSPDWSYGAQKSSSNGMFSYGDNKHTVADSHQSYNNKPVSIAVPVQAFNQNQQVAIAAAAADFSVGSNLSNPESGKGFQEKPATVTREQIDEISNISASIAQFLANGQPIPKLTQPLHSESCVAVQPNQTQSNAVSSNNNLNLLWGLGMSNGAEGVPPVATSHISNVDGIQELALHPKASEENGDKKASKEGDGKKTGEDVEGDDDGSDEENKKGKDPKAFKFALVEIVKELLKPAWKEGKMDKDGYKNIVKKVVEKVTGTMQTGNVPQTQDKIEHYLSASKPKLTKLVQCIYQQIQEELI